MNGNLWKILIADDEPKIRRGLRSQIERLNLPARVIGEAEDGEIALEMAEQLRPDILLVDINMPFMNGLDFIRSLRRTRADAKIIVITGYEEFEYARQALELNAHAYLLKPIEVEELKNALATAIDGLSAERERSRHFEWAIAQIGDRRDFLQEEFLRDAIAGRLEADEIRDFRVYFDFPRPVRMMLMLVALRSDAMDEKPWKNLLRRYALQDALGEIGAQMRYSCLFCDDRGNVLVLYDAPEEVDARIGGIAKSSLESELGVQVRTAVQPLSSLTQLPEVYDTVLERVIGSTRISPIVEAAKRHIVTGYSDPEMGLNSVSDALGVHPAYLSRLMKQELGMPFAKYLTSVRINKAIQLMRDPNMRIWQVAELVGYSGGNYFSTAFKKVLGVSPADYRLEDRKL